MESKSVRFWAIINGVLVVSLMGAAIFGGSGVVQNERLTDELQRVNLLNQDLQAQNEVLRREVEQLEHDPDYVEAVVRDELGWVKPDEVVLIVPRDGAPN